MADQHSKWQSAAAVPGAPAARRILTVSQLTARLKSHIEGSFNDIWVEGEISNLRSPPSGHLYFSLKDRDSQIRAVLFRNGGRRPPFVPADGQSVLVRGHLTIYEPRGDYQIIVDYVEPVGVGALQAAFEQLKARLAAEGLFDPARKRPLPSLPRCLGIVTSPTGAVIRDMLTILARRFANLHIIINPVPVQGAEAAGRIADAIDELNALGLVDVIIIARGGGSLEDLWAFNEEIVARAIARSGVPVISAVGHETDVTIADFVADLRAPTPSAAAELVVRSKAELLDRVEQLRLRLARSLRQSLLWQRDRVQREGRALTHPRRAIERSLQRTDELDGRLRVAASRVAGHRREFLRVRLERIQACSPRDLIRVALQRQEQLQERLAGQIGRLANGWRENVSRRAAQLHHLSPLAILARGYSIAQRLPDGAILRSAQTISRGDRIRLVLHEGELEAVVQEIRAQRTRPVVESAD